MEATQYMEVRVEDGDSAENRGNLLQLPRFRQPKWWFRVIIYTTFIVFGNAAATLLGRFYYDNGGNCKWLAAFLMSAGFPISIPLLVYFSSDFSRINVSIGSCFSLYAFFVILYLAANMMYAYGLLYLPVSTYSLICATQLAFNAIFSFLLNSQKFTALIFNSLFLLTTSASLLAVHPEDVPREDLSAKPEHTYIVGILITVCASATYALFLSLSEMSFKKVLGKGPYQVALEMQVYPCVIATCGSVVGLYFSGEWETLPVEMQGFVKGRVSYVMTLVWTAVSWQVMAIGMFGLLFEVSSLFSSVISTISLPIVPIIGLVFFHDKVDGVKVIALLLAVGGFISYVYQGYLDDVNARDSVSCEDPFD